MSRTRVAVACEGGGSQCVFVAGALKALLAAHVHSFLAEVT
jgi:predicted patatin/cPLA2 family phospholipase